MKKLSVSSPEKEERFQYFMDNVRVIVEYHTGKRHMCGQIRLTGMVDWSPEERAIIKNFRRRRGDQYFNASDERGMNLGGSRNGGRGSWNDKLRRGR